MKKGKTMAAGNASSSSKVTNVSNSGQMSTQTSVTGATGAVSNNTNITSQNGANGAPGVSSTTINNSSGSNISPSGNYTIPPIPGVNSGPAGSISINPTLGATHPMPATGQIDQARAAYTQVEGHLAQARQQALAQAKFAGQPIQDQINTAFDNATTSLANQRKSMGY